MKTQKERIEDLEAEVRDLKRRIARAEEAIRPAKPPIPREQLPYGAAPCPYPWPGAAPAPVAPFRLPYYEVTCCTIETPPTSCRVVG